MLGRRGKERQRRVKRLEEGETFKDRERERSFLAAYPRDKWFHAQLTTCHRRDPPPPSSPLFVSRSSMNSSCSHWQVYKFAILSDRYLSYLAQLLPRFRRTCIHFETCNATNVDGMILLIHCSFEFRVQVKQIFLNIRLTKFRGNT